jgi:hypothetical protein
MRESLEDKVKCISAWALGQVDLLGQIAPVRPSGLPFYGSICLNQEKKKNTLKKKEKKKKKRGLNI